MAATDQPERFEGYAAPLGRHFEGFAFAPPEERRIGTLFMDVSSRKQSEAHLKLMVDELNHRVKNTLAVVQGVLAGKRILVVEDEFLIAQTLVDAIQSKGAIGVGPAATLKRSNA